jgi:hypothetical protein
MASITNRYTFDIECFNYNNQIAPIPPLYRPTFNITMRNQYSNIIIDPNNPITLEAAGLLIYIDIAPVIINNIWLNITDILKLVQLSFFTLANDTVPFFVSTLDTFYYDGFTDDLLNPPLFNALWIPSYGDDYNADSNFNDYTLHKSWNYTITNIFQTVNQNYCTLMNDTVTKIPAICVSKAQGLVNYDGYLCTYFGTQGGGQGGLFPTFGTGYNIYPNSNVGNTDFDNSTEFIMVVADISNIQKIEFNWNDTQLNMMDTSLMVNHLYNKRADNNDTCIPYWYRLDDCVSNQSYFRANSIKG